LPVHRDQPVGTVVGVGVHPIARQVAPPLRYGVLRDHWHPRCRSLHPRWSNGWRYRRCKPWWSGCCLPNWPVSGGCPRRHRCSDSNRRSSNPRLSGGSRHRRCSRWSSCRLGFPALRLAFQREIHRQFSHERTRRQRL
jgi:hypothetical protein